MGSAVAAHCRLEKFTSWRCDVHGIAKNDSKCGVQVSAKTIDDSNGHHLDTRSYFGAVDRGRRRFRLCLLKIPKGREKLEIFAPPPYRRGHAHNSFRPRFPALVPRSQPRLPGALARRPATSGDCPAAATPWSASALLHRPAPLGVALPGLAAGPQRHGAGQANNRHPVASQRLPALLAVAITPSGPAQDGHRDP